MTDDAKIYYRPLPRFDLPRPAHALPLAGGPGWFESAERLSREDAPRSVPLSEVPQDWRERLSSPRPAIAGMALDRTRVMGILNVTPDSFSDGGRHITAAAALAQAHRMVSEGVDMIDVGGESTRPGAETVPVEAEIARVEPVVHAIASELSVPISIDTRKSAVAEAATEAGASLVNDVSGFTYDPMLARLCADRALPLCVMHTKGDPQTMQQSPRYDDVLLEVYDFLETQVAMLEAMGIPRGQITVDPGIGFGKTIHHNLALMARLSLFHGLGCGVLLGASRKGFIGTLSGAHPAAARMPGSVACALAGAAHGVQIVRVHDVAETAQALAVWRATASGVYSDEKQGEQS
jgi:dihydropteroate synthase